MNEKMNVEVHIYFSKMQNSNTQVLINNIKDLSVFVYNLYGNILFHFISDDNEYQQKLGVNLAIDRRPIQGGVLHSQLLNTTESSVLNFNF